MKKEYHPPHLYHLDKIYFVTCRTAKMVNYFGDNRKKDLLWSIIKEAKIRFNIKFFGYVILANHYHLLIRLSDEVSTGVPALAGDNLGNLPKDRTPEGIGKIVGFVNGRSSFELNKLDKVPGRQVWYQYWDRCIRNKKDFYIRLNYIHQNPVKHNETKDMYDYQFSSISDYQEKYGREWLNSCLRDYPIVDFECFGE